MTNLYQQLNPQPNNLTSFINTVKNTRNPQQLLMNMAQNNPDVKKTLDLIKMSNKHPRELFYETAKQRGVDPNTILNMLK